MEEVDPSLRVEHRHYGSCSLSDVGIRAGRGNVVSFVVCLRETRGKLPRSLPDEYTLIPK